MLNQDLKMKNKSATIYIRGIVADNETFYVVSAKQFFLALVQLNQTIEIDLRLKETHGLETYHIDRSQLDNVRYHGIYTTLLGYFHNSTYHIHYILYNIIENLLTVVDKYNLGTIKANLKVKEFVPTKVRRVC